MIEKIRRIRSFGPYASFDWPADLCDFKRFNVFYGWNYSGKTMLSRVFRCLEANALHPDFPLAEAHVDCTGGTSCALAAPNALLDIRVFNTEFVRDNLKFDAGKAVPILILGAADIAKQTELNDKKKRSENLELARREARERRNGIIASLEKALT